MAVFVWGANKYWQLPAQTASQLSAPAPAVDAFDGQRPIQVAAGDQHSLVLCESGQIFAFGIGKEGQLGCGAEEARRQGHKVVGLDHETIEAIAAGSHSSFAVTASGRVYHWGLIHSDGSDNVSDHSAGRLAGLAADQDLAIEVHEEERSDRERRLNADRDPAVAAGAGRRQRATAAAATHTATHTVTPQVRYLRDIVRSSTERWLLSTEDADEEYYRELRAMGYKLDEVENIMEERGREYHGMLRMECRRRQQYTPLLITLPAKVRIVSVAAGYAHTMLLSETGTLYAAGYNDRGQLGLGHRINTSAFKEVSFLARYCVVQVACGQQHTICRAVPRNSAAAFVGTASGADVYTWGNGILGQLGLGRRGTTKGRLLPTLVPSLRRQYPAGIRDVAAGANFSVVVTEGGQVLSFGHAEYNQHGSGHMSHMDYVDPYLYFEPRPVRIESEGDHEIPRIISVACGAAYTLALAENGRVFSWGWNEAGVLGHGFGHFATAPRPIPRLGGGHDRVTMLSCGAQHCMAVVEARGSSWAPVFYRSILQQHSSCDVELVIEVPKKGLATVERFPCHRALLAARSAYLRGFLRSAEAGAETSGMLQLHLTEPCFTPFSVTALLEYLYLDRVTLAFNFQKETELAAIAELLALPGLVSHLHPAKQAVEMPCFAADLHWLYDNPLYADVVFVVREEGDDQARPILYAHQFILNNLPYFAPMFTGKFAEGNWFLSMGATLADRPAQTAALRTALMHHDALLQRQLQRDMVVIDITDLAQDGIDSSIFQQLVHYAYTGQANSASSDQPEQCIASLMHLLVASQRLDFGLLAAACERKLIMRLREMLREQLHDGGDVEGREEREEEERLVVSECLALADLYGLQRLQDQCHSFLHRQTEA